MKTIKTFEKEYFDAVYGHEGLVDRDDIFSFNLKEIKKRKPHAKKLLDIGCAYGDFLRLADKSGYETYGNEVSAHALEKAARNTKAQLALFDSAKEKWPYPDSIFDIVTVFDVIEHVKPADTLLQESYRVLKRGGLLFITTPNNQGWYGRLSERWFPDDPTHINKQKPAVWKKKLVKIGFKKVETKGVLFHGFPPTPKVRNILRMYKVPVAVRPVYFPLVSLCGTVFLWAEK